jgi:hypothetical protein
MNDKRLVKWHTIKSFDVYNLSGNVGHTIKLLQDAIYAAAFDYPGLPLQFDADVDYCTSDHRQRDTLNLQVMRPENDEEYNKRMAAQQVNEDYARKQYEELKKRFKET